MDRLVLDTNIVIGYFKGDQKLKPILESAKVWCLPIQVVGELYYGAYRSTRKAENLSLYKDFVAKTEVLFPDEKVAEVYGQLKVILRQNGTPIPENDVWIASIALAENLPLATLDKHFLNIPDLTLSIQLE